MRMSLRLASWLITALVPAMAHAGIVRSAADGFHLHYRILLAASPATVYDRLVHFGRWWDARHTYSGKAGNLGLDARAGGCLCERWTEGSIEHARVAAVLPGRLLVLDGALGPLQAMAVKGVLRFALTPANNGTVLTVDYRVNGSSLSGLEAVAPAVDRVLDGQLGRLARFATAPSARNRNPSPARARPRR